MSKIEELIKKLCPNGVECKDLNSVFKLFSGMRDVSNKWKETGNCQFIDYMNAYKNQKIDVTKLPYATVKSLNQNILKRGDLLLTSASEVREECAICSVIENDIEDNIFMDDHLFGLRLKDMYIDKINTTFISYYLNSEPFRCNLKKAIRGVTRFYISNDNYLKLKVPVPPLEVQEEIVRILDKFGELETELEAELEARKSQYEFWRGKLLNNNASKIVKLGEVCLVSSGGTPSKKKTEYWENGDIKWLGSSVCCNKKTVEEVTDKITEVGLKNSSAKILTPKTTLIAMVGATIGKVAFLEFEACTNQNVASLIPKDTSFLNSDYLFYACRNLYSQFVEYSKGKFSIASLGYIKNLEIKVPSLQEQERIVNILDKFDKLVNDISEGLPAEIEARRKQYEYYRNKLLSFEELVVNE